MTGLIKLFIVGVVLLSLYRILSGVFGLIKPEKRSNLRRPTQRRLPEAGAPDRNLLPWRRFAEFQGLSYSEEYGPRISGEHDGIDVVIVRDQNGSGTTSACATTGSAAAAELEIYRADFAERGENLVTTGDGEFDREFVTVCRWPSFARQVLGGNTMPWMLALGDVELSVTKTRVVATTPRHEVEADRMRALLELAVESARRAAG